MEAHSGLSARLVEEAGFAGIWASGFSIAASMALPDRNVASWTEVLQIVDQMVERTTIPILLDGDTGYGDHNNVRRLVEKLEQHGVAGVCIEDKLFPKRNSFLRGTRQPLADVDEFCAKIKAAKDAQRSDDFVMVARVEAFIAGLGLDEAMERAEAYRSAGADAILIHSAKRTADEILQFKAAWGDRLPVVIVPTKYYTTPTEVFAEARISVCIWANHLLRASAAAMQRTAREIFTSRSLLSAESSVASMAEVFRLQGEPALAELEKRYLPEAVDGTRAIILAASRGVELGALTEHEPKAMVAVRNRPLVSWVLDAYRDVGVNDVVVVRGYGKGSFNLAGVEYVDNDDFASTGEVWSLWQAREWLEGQTVISYGDVLFRKHIAQLLIDCDADFVIPVEAQWQESAQAGRSTDYVRASGAHARGTYYAEVLLREVGPSLGANGGEVHGEWIGLLKVSSRGAEILRALLEQRSAGAELTKMNMPDLLNAVVAAGHAVRVVYTTGHWIDIDGIEDVVRLGNFW